MSEYLIRTLLNDIDIDPPKKLSIKYPIHGLGAPFCIHTATTDMFHVGYFIDNSALIGTE